MVDCHPIITLTTDYGAESGYVASVKGIILGINPGVNIVDICHHIRPQDILQAAFIISTVYQYFPHGTAHIIVVDPGVGSYRKSLLLEMEGFYFIAPDNGTLSYVLNGKWGVEEKTRRREKRILSLRKLPPQCRAVSIDQAQYWRQPVSRTFHGRDIYAPVAAYLSKGVPMEGFGTKLKSVHVLQLPRPYLDEGRVLNGEVLHIDSFGNLITNIREVDLGGRCLNCRSVGRASTICISIMQRVKD